MSSKGKGRVNAALAAAALAALPTAAADVEITETEQPAATVATMVAEPAGPTQKRGKSKIQFPVAYVWVLCHNAIAAARKAGEAAPSRKALVAKAISDGVTFYTARTQVQAYLKATANGTRVPKSLPRSVVLSPIAAS